MPNNPRTDAEMLAALALRCEQATGADRELETDIFRAVYPERVPEVTPDGQYGWKEGKGGWWLLTGSDARCPIKQIVPPNWLTSLDAAMRLVPEGWHGASVTLNPNGRGRAVCWDKPGKAFPVNAATPALALTAAALRARASQGAE
jgi:hypothetical protein